MYEYHNIVHNFKNNIFKEYNMVQILINPGTWETSGNIDTAEENIKIFIKDLGKDFIYERTDKTHNGRFIFIISNKEESYEIAMVGENIEGVRYIDTFRQRIMDFPRLYVNENSYVWIYAIQNITKESENVISKRLGLDIDKIKKGKNILHMYSCHCKNCKYPQLSYDEVRKMCLENEDKLDEFFISKLPCNLEECKIQYANYCIREYQKE